MTIELAIYVRLLDGFEKLGFDGGEVLQGVDVQEDGGAVAFEAESPG